MPSNNATPPAVLTFSGLDPTGGAGSQADIETLISLGCHCCPVVTAVTSQDTCNIKNFSPTLPAMVVEQARAVLEDIQISAFKIGMLGSVDNVESIHSILMDYPDIPVVFDPVITAGGGGNLSSDAIVEASISLLLPQTTLITPNSLEAREYSPGADSLEACAHELMELGAEHVLITGSHERTDSIQNRLWGNQRFIADFTWERLPGQFHGSGCTLAAATAGLLAHGVDMVTAARNAQAYTFNTLKNARRLGMGQLIPYRMFWADSDQDESKTETNQSE
jgi:hydroxymethylpyrimidine/phosphomethylpyrimidine kinase